MVLRGSVSADFRQFQVGGDGEKGSKIRNGQEERVQIVIYCTYKQSWPLLGITDLCGTVD